MRRREFHIVAQVTDIAILPGIALRDPPGWLTLGVDPFRCGRVWA